MTTSRLAGHGLLHEGWPFIGTKIRATNNTGPGMGKCECGAMSEMVPTRAARKRWHRDHKADIRARADAGRQAHEETP